jgi:hypothetical protein
MSKQMASQPIFAEFTRSRRLQLIREEEAAEWGNITCLLHMMQWSDATEGPVPYNPWAEGGADQQFFIRGPYDPDCMWSLEDNTVIKFGGANLLSIVDLGNVMRTMNRQDQDRFKLQMFRVLATGRFLEIRCQDLHEGLREEQERCRDQARKKKVAQTELAAMNTVLVSRSQVRIDAPTVQRQSGRDAGLKACVTRRSR